MPGLKLVSRFQLAFAMLMFLGSPAWIGLLVVGTLALAASPTPADFIRPDAGMRCSAIILVMWFAPKIATVLDVLTRPELRRAFGGAVRFLASVVTETMFFILLSPIMWVCHTLFLAGLPFGRVIGWIGQVRDDHTRAVVAMALRQLWPHTLLGLVLHSRVLAATHPVAVPLRASCWPAARRCRFRSPSSPHGPRVGRALTRIGIGRLPEETAPPRRARRRWRCPRSAAAARRGVNHAASSFAPRAA